MNNNLRIIFIGTPEFAELCLKRLVQENYNVVGVVTVCDKPAGRGRKLNESKVKQYAKSKGLPVLQPKNLKSEEFLSDLEELKADLFIVVAFRMLPKVVWAMPKYGTFNLHTSLLPEYRGSAPINWAIINGEKRSGVTSFFIDEKIDAGEILLQREIPIGEEDIFADLYYKMIEVGSQVIIETVDLIATGKAKPIKQDQRELKIAPKIFAEDCEIDWTKPVQDIYNFIRGLNPYPIAKTTIYDNEESIKIQIFGIEKEVIKHDHKIGNLIVGKKELKIAVSDGFIHIKEIKAAGKKKMDAVSFLNGFKFKNETPSVIRK